MVEFLPVHTGTVTNRLINSAFVEVKIELVPGWLGGIGQDVFLGSSHALDFERAGEAELPRYESNRPWVTGYVAAAVSRVPHLFGDKV